MVVVVFHAEEPKTWPSNSFQICEHFLSAIVCALMFFKLVVWNRKEVSGIYALHL